MRLSKNSWYYKMYTLLNGTNALPPKDLCTYFWKYLVFQNILAIILIPIWLIPHMIIRVFTKFIHFGEIYVDSKREGIMSFVLLLYFILEVIIFLAVSIVFAIIDMFTGHNTVVGTVGIAVMISITVAFICHKANQYKEERKSRKRGNKVVKRPNILISYIKSVKERYCPVIEWEDNDS